MEENKKPKQRGGRRENSGRKSKGGEDGTRHMGFRCSPDVFEILQQVPNKTEYIEAAIRFKWKHDHWGT